MTFTLTDGILLSIILICFGLILFFTFKKKKKYGKCHGCPYLKTCTKNTCNKENNK